MQKFLLCKTPSILHEPRYSCLIRTPVLLWTLFLTLSELSCNSGGKSNSSGHSIEPKLSSIQREIFDESCDAPSCHGSGKKGNLSLVAGNSFAQLVDVRSTADKKKRTAFSPRETGKPGFQPSFRQNYRTGYQPGRSDAERN